MHALRPWLAALLLAHGCARESPKPASKAVLESPAVELAGALYLEPSDGDPIPVFDAEHLPRLWTKAPLPLELRWRGPAAAPLPSTSRAVDGGHTLRVGEGPPALGDGRLELVSHEAVIWSRSARWVPVEPEATRWPEVAAARRQARAGDREALIRAWLAAADAVPAGHSERARRTLAAAHFAIGEGALGEAAKLLDASKSAAAAIEAARLRMQGSLLRQLADYRGAARALTRAYRIADRFDLAVNRNMIRESQALLLDELGRPEEALEHLEAAAEYARATGGTTLGRWHVNRGWLRLRQLTARRGRRDWTGARADLQAALRSDWSAPNRAKILSNLAWLELSAGRLSVALQTLDDADRTDPESRGTDWGFRIWLRGQLRLASGQPAAAEADFARLADYAMRALPSGGDLGWRARFGQGQAAEARGELAAASQAYGAAQTLLDAVSRRAVLRGGQASFLDNRRDLVDAAITLHLKVGRPMAAFADADRARSRLLQGRRTQLAVERLTLEGRRRWASAMDRLSQRRQALEGLEAALELSAGAARLRTLAERDQAREARDEAADAALALLGDALDAPAWNRPRLAPDEALIEARRVGVRWAVFLLRGDTVAVRWDPERLTAGWGDRLGGVSHLYVVPGGHPHASAVEHDFQGRGSVAWLPAAALLSRPIGTPPSLRLAAVDPDGTLPSDRALAARVSPGPGDLRLIGRQVTREALISGLARAGVVYFGGHGILDRSRPWAAHLRLADNQRLDVTDALMARSPGAVVFLNGCETGPVDTFQRADVLGLPEAFLVAGARSVVAAERAVPDAAATRFAAAFFQAGGATAPAKALRTVRQALRAQGDPIWDAYHLFGRR